MEPLEPEFVQKALESSDEYSEDLRQRHISSPVFDHARIVQREFLNTRLTSKDFIPAWNAAHETIAQLDDEAEAQGVLFENVILRGEGILVPKFEVDFAASIAMVSLLGKEVQEARSFEAFLRLDEYRGKFAGFTLRFAETEDVGVFVPILAYRVSVNRGHSAHLEATLFATGDLGSTALNFEDDDKFEDALVPLEELFELCPEHGATINRINMTLAGTNTYDASIMDHVAVHSEKIVSAVDEAKRIAVEDALANLIIHYVGRSSSYLAQAKKFSRSPKVGTTDMLYYDNEEEVYLLHNVCLDFVFFNEAIVKDKQVTHSDHRALHVAMPYGDGIAYVPLVKIELFEKQ